MIHQYNRIITLFFAIACLLAFSTPAALASESSKPDELQRKIADIALLKQQLADRKAHAAAIQATLLKQQDDLVAEVRLLQKSFGFKSYQQAKKFDRARHNIGLLQTIIAYNRLFAEKIKIYQTGHDKLNYLQQLAEDDIKMIRTMNDFEIDALTTQISLVINRYLREAHVIQIDQKHMELVPPEKVWDGIVKGRY